MKTAFIILLSICSIISYAQERVGINTTSPQFTLDIRTSAPILGAELNLANQGGNHFLRFFPGHDQDPKPYLFFSNMDTFRIANGASNFGGFTERLTIQPGGNVGIGIGQPSNKLHLHDPEVFTTPPPFELTFGNPNYLQVSNGVTGSSTSDGLILGINQGGQGEVQHPSLLLINAGSAQIALNTTGKTISIDSNIIVQGNVNIQTLAGQGERRLTVNSNGDITAGQLIQGSAGNTVIDIDGNAYPTVIIGTQEWMTENLRTTKYNDGVKIPHAPKQEVWVQTDNGHLPAYCWYDNSEENIYPYGALYNWYVVDATANGGRNVCPTGWHIPTGTEYFTLATFLDGQFIAGAALKSSGDLTGNSGLWTLPNTGATNSSGFSGIPGGLRTNSVFFSLGVQSYYWTVLEQLPDTATGIILYHDGTEINFLSYSKVWGLSIRCVKD